MRRLSASLLAAVSIVGCRGAAAQAADEAVILSGASTFVVADCATDRIRLRWQSSPTTIAPASGDVTTSIVSKGADVVAQAWTIDWQEPVRLAGDGAEMSSTGTLTGPCPPPGRYTVPVLIRFTKLSKGTEVGITVVRKGTPVLELPTSVTLPLRVYPFGLGGVEVPGIAIDETSMASAAPLLSVTGGVLKDANGETAGPILTVVLDGAPLAAGGHGMLSGLLSQTPWPGTLTTHLTVHAPPLPDKGIDVVLKSRIGYFYLLAMLASGVGLGWFNNLWLAGRQAVAQARIAAFRSAAALLTRSDAQRDPIVQQRIVATIRDLESFARTSTAAADITAAEKSANDKVDAIEKKAALDPDAYGRRSGEVNATLTPTGPLAPEIAAALAPIRIRLETVDRIAASGPVEDASAQLAALASRLVDDIAAALRPWLRGVVVSLDGMGKWGDATTEPEAKRTALRDEASKLFQTPDVDGANGLAERLGTWTNTSLAMAAAASISGVAAILRSGKAPETSQQLLMKLAEDTRGALPQTLLATLAATRGRMVAELMRLAPPGVDVDDDLSRGLFAEAAARVAPVPGPKITAAGAAQQVPLIATPTPLANPPSARLTIASRIKMGAPTTVCFVQNGSKQTVSVWSCDPPAKITSIDGSSASVTPDRSGFLTISAKLDNDSLLTVLTFVGEPIASADSVAVDEDSRLLAVSSGVIVSVVTVAVGYVIFADGWFGSGKDAFAAFAWGFFGPFGLDRIKDLSKTLLPKAASAA